MPSVHPVTRLGLVHAYLVEEEDGLTLVDTLIPGSAKALQAAAASLAKPILRIAITHGHVDHVGSLDALRAELPGAELVVGAREAKLLAGDLARQPGETASPRSFNFPRVKVRPDRLVVPGDRVGSLEVHDGAGHTPGQIAFLDTRDGTLYCGDALHTIGGEPRPTDRGTLRFPLPSVVVFDAAAAKRNGQALLALDVSRVAPGHGQVIVHGRRPVTFALALYDVVLFVHIAAVVIAFGATFAYPLLFAAAAKSPPAQRAALHDFQARYGRTYASFGLLVVVLAGAYLASDRDLWGEPWVGGPLLIALIIGGIGGGFLAPRERRLAELSAAGDEDPDYRKTLGQVKLGGAISSGLVLVAIFLMVTKVGG